MTKLVAGFSINNDLYQYLSVFRINVINKFISRLR